MMKFCVAAVSGVILTSSVHTSWADGSLKDSGVVSSSGLSGFYIGGIGSHASGKSTSTEVGSIVSLFGVAPSSFNSTSKGYLGGVQLGYDRQVGSFLVGVRGDLSKGNVSAQIADPIVPTGSVISETGLAGSLVGRLGYSVSSVLVYGVAGASWAKVQVTSTPLVATENTTMAGFLIGGGVELSLSKHVSLVTEYNHVDYGSHTWFSSVPCGGVVGGCSNTSDAKSQVVKVGLNYKF